MRILSLFSGIGGFELGIQRAYASQTARLQQNNGVKNADSTDTRKQFLGTQPLFVGYSEINKPAISVYETHFKETKNFGNISRIPTRTIPDFDLLTFGWPCQDNSIAGKRKGQKRGTRSGLLFEAIRILRAKKPKYFIAENVTGLFSIDRYRGFYETLRLFTDAGYEYQWQVLNTVWFLPQNRERIYIVGHIRGQRRPEVFPIPSSGQTSFKARSREDFYAGCLSEKNQSGQLQIDRGTTLIQYMIPKNSRTIRGGGRNSMSSKHNWDSYPVSGRVRRLTPRECERLQGFPDDWTRYAADGTEISDSQRYKMIGNAVSVPVVQAIFEKLLEFECLTPSN